MQFNQTPLLLHLLYLAGPDNPMNPAGYRARRLNRWLDLMLLQQLAA